MSFFGKNRHKSEHQRVDGLLSAYLDDELSARERQTVEAHLATCADCRWNLETLRQTVQWTRELPSEPLPRVFTISAPAPARARPARRRNWGFGLLQGATALVALLFVVAILGDFALIGFGSDQTAAVSQVQQEQAVEALDTQPVEAVRTTVLEMEAPAAPEAAEPEVLPLEAAPAPESSPMRQMVAASEASPSATSVASPTPSPEVRGLGAPGFESTPKEEAVAGEGAPTPAPAAKAPPPTMTLTETYGTADAALPEEEPEAAVAGGGDLTPTLAPLAATTVARVEEPVVQPAAGDDKAAEAPWQDALAPWLRLAEIVLGLAFILLASLTIVVVLRSRRLR
jgi:hypothetical protein